MEEQKHAPNRQVYATKLLLVLVGFSSNKIIRCEAHLILLVFVTLF